MNIRELMQILLEYPRDLPVYVGKGTGPLGKIDSRVSDDIIYVILSPEK
jgi:hypothetical protein